MTDTVDNDKVVKDLDERTVEDRIKDFSSLLNQIESLNDKKRQLWLEIYENAISDRQNSYAMFFKLVRIVEDKSNEHAIHGKTIATYIERMSKANDQLIKLAELIAKADEANDEIDSNDMYERMKKTA